jgi:hypothetical protein
MTEHTRALSPHGGIDTSLREARTLRCLLRVETALREARTIRSLQALKTALREAVTESMLAYDFSANSYTFATMSACNAAERALENLRESRGTTTMTTQIQ